MNLPVVLTSGDPAGVGLELTLLAWKALRLSHTFFLVADRSHLAAISCDVNIVEIDRPDQAVDSMSLGLPLYHLEFGSDATPGTAKPSHSSSIIESIDLAIAWARKGLVAGICTNPVNKDVFQNLSLGSFPGHTEYLSHSCGTDYPVMMIAGNRLRVVPVTTHIPLAEVSRSLSRQLVGNTISICHEALRKDFGLRKPRIAVAGLNPHAGEGGLLGSEEITIIKPSIDSLQEQGLDVCGPLSADTLFHEERRKDFDLVVCMFHDQALIPIKTIEFHSSVNVTLGLPIVRTSPDHGTALNLAGKGLANPQSLIQAIRLTERISRSRYSRE